MYAQINQFMRMSTENCIEETKYIIIILRRTVQEDGENVIVRNQISAVEDITIE